MAPQASLCAARHRGELPCRRRGFARAPSARLAPIIRPATAHTGYYFQEDMATWLAGSPTPTSFDRGMRNAWHALAEAAYPTRAYASHMPQIVNKSLANEIFDRFVTSRDAPAYDEWSLYFNVANQLYPRHFASEALWRAWLADAPRRLAAGARAARSCLRELLSRRIMRRPEAACSWGSSLSAISTPRRVARRRHWGKRAAPSSKAAARMRQARLPSSSRRTD